MSLKQNEIAFQSRYDAGLEFGMSNEEALYFAETGERPNSFNLRQIQESGQDYVVVGGRAISLSDFDHLDADVPREDRDTEDAGVI